MSIDASTLPISPAFMLTAACIAALFAFGAGPEIARREIARSDWQELCQADLQADIEITRRPEQVIPEVPDLCGIFANAYPELGEVCDYVPDPTAAAREAEQRLQKAEEARIRRRLEKTTDACTCAETIYVEEERLALALYASTGRLITPSPVEHREAALNSALRAPACQREG